MPRRPDPWKQVQRAIAKGDTDMVAYWRGECAKEHAERCARNEAKVARKANGPVSILSTLDLNASRLFTQYRTPSQLSSAIQTIRRWHGKRFKCATEFDLIDGGVAGVRVTRVA